MAKTVKFSEFQEVRDVGQFEFIGINKQTKKEARLSDLPINQNELDPLAIPLIHNIEDKIPSTASSTNKLADQNFVNSSIQNIAANRVTYNAAGSPFPSRASLSSAVTVYHSGSAYTPTQHDYCTIISDEGAIAPFTGGQTRHEYDGSKWVFVEGINERPFTAAENAVLSSGVTGQIINDFISFMEGEFGGIGAKDFPVGDVVIEISGPPVLITGISITPAVFTIDSGLSRQLVATIMPANATTKAVNWSVSDPTKASISPQGLVTAITPGTVVITATAADGSGVFGTAQMNIQEIQPGIILVESIALNYNTATINPSDTIQLTAIISPTNAANRTVSWSSRNPEIATVTSNGLITGVSSGSTIITCAANDASGVIAQVNLTVANIQNTEKMIAHWDFGRYADGYQGQIEDLSGFGNSPTLYGLEQWADGMNGIKNGQMMANYANGQIAAPPTTSVMFTLPAALDNPSLLTVETVIHLRARKTNASTMIIPSMTGSNNTLVQRIESGNRFIRTYITSSELRVAGPAAIPAGSVALNTIIDGYPDPDGNTYPLSDKLHHIVITFGNTTTGTDVYINGTRVLNTDGRNDDITGDLLHFFGGANNLRGDINEVKLYNSIIDAAAVTRKYNEMKIKYSTLI